MCIRIFWHSLAIVIVFLLTSCGSAPPQPKMGDTPYNLLQNVPVEIIYVDSAYPIRLVPQPSGSMAAAAAPVLGALGAVVGSLVDSNQAQKAQEASQKQLQPYQGEINKLDLTSLVLSRVEAALAGIPALAKAKVSHIPATGLALTSHDLALKSDAQEVILVIPQTYFWPDAKALGVSAQITVFIKPHLGQAVQYESHGIGGNSRLPLPKAAKLSVETCLKQWFQDDGVQLQKGFDDASAKLTRGFQIYFHQDAQPAA